MFYSKIIELCSEEGISPTAFIETILKMSRSNITKWKDGKVPKSDTVNKIAAYFGVSTDYLLGNSDTKNKPTTVSDDGLSAEKRLMIEKINTMNDSQVSALNAIADSILKLREK